MRTRGKDPADIPTAGDVKLEQEEIQIDMFG